MLQRTGGWGGGVDVVDSGMRNGDWSAGCGKLGCVQLKGEESRDQNSRIGAKYTKTSRLTSPSCPISVPFSTSILVWNTFIPPTSPV